MAHNTLIETNHPSVLQVILESDICTTQLAQMCAAHLGAGDTVLLSGPVGAGKSHFARALIRSFLGPWVDVPSPSFTLVQVYETDSFEIWHADLYRLSSTSEVAELGLYDAMGSQLCLIEWPDRLHDAPAQAVSIDLSYLGEGRRARISGASPALSADVAKAFTK